MATQQVLVIDDEEMIQQIIQGCLEDLGGLEVITASSGAEGLLKAASERPGVILLDISMPGMDGIETFQKLQENPVTQDIPVILLTAKVQPADQKQFAQLKIASMISKPFDPVALVRQVSALINSG